MSELSLFGTLITQIWQLTLLTILVGLIVRIVAKNRPQVAHAMWILVLVKALTPPLMSSPVGLFCWTNSSFETIETRSESSQIDLVFQGSADDINRDSAPQIESSRTAPHGSDSLPSSDVRNSAPRPADSESEPLRFVNPAKEPRTLIWDVTRNLEWQTLLVIFWLTGAVFGLVVLLFRYLFFLRWLARGTELESTQVVELTKQLIKQLKIRRKIRVSVLNNSVGPVALGLFQPRIVLPEAIVRGKSSEDLAPILAHELIHFRRGDLWWALLQVGAKYLFWFHPLVWWAERQASTETERCCDEETIAGLGCSPAHYAKCLLEVLERKHQLRVAPALPGVRPVEITYARLERVMKLGKGVRHHDTRWFWTTLLLGGIMALPGATWSQNQEKSEVAPSVVHNKAIPESSERDDIVTESEMNDFFGSFHQKQEAPSNSDAIYFRSSICRIDQATLDSLGIDWQTFLAWPEASSNQTMKLIDTRSMTVISRIPAPYSVLDSAEFNRILSDLKSAKDSRVIQRLIAGTGAATAQVAQYDQVLVEYPPAAFDKKLGLTPPSNSRKIDQGIEISLYPLRVASGKLKLGVRFHSAEVHPSVQEFVPASKIGGQKRPQPGQWRPELTYRYRSIIAELEPDQHLVMVGSDENNQPALLFLECLTAPQQATLKQRIQHSAACQILPSQSDGDLQYLVMGYASPQEPVGDLNLTRGCSEQYRFTVPDVQVIVADPDLLQIEFVKDREAIFTPLRSGQTTCTLQRANQLLGRFEVTVNDPTSSEPANNQLPRVSIPAAVGLACRVQFQLPIKNAVAMTEHISIRRVNDREILVTPSKAGEAQIKVEYLSHGSLQLEVSIEENPSRVVRVSHPASYRVGTEPVQPPPLVTMLTASDPVPAWKLVCEDDSPDDLAHSRVVWFGGYKSMALTPSISVTQTGDRLTLSGKNLRWLDGDHVIAQAEFGELSFTANLPTNEAKRSPPKVEGLWYRIRLDGDAQYWLGHEQFWQADQITHESGTDAPRYAAKGNVRILSAAPIPGSLSFNAAYDATADEVTVHHRAESPLELVGNVRVVLKSIDGEDQTFEGEKIQSYTPEGQMRFDFRVVEPKQ